MTEALVIERAYLLDVLLLRAVRVSRAWSDPANANRECIAARWYKGGIATTWIDRRAS